ncbi:MAG TPA: anthranilate phosphoribosyltransferase [Egibacteraceae bacterium]|nr:anthranilate phosphoribosyltransferase [Egibacteraceae bacterium]
MTSGSHASWPALLTRLLAGEDLDDATTASAMTAIMEGETSPAQVAGFLMALRAKGETADEIAGLVRAMRRYALPVRIDGPLLDTCGTGGDRAGTFNVSTVAALVAAGAGATVAKHGNRAASGRCGSADLLEAWGVVVDLPPPGVEACIRKIGIGFCFAPVFHPAMRHAMPARRELGVPTVFNFLGPLTNPAGARHQTIGVSDAEMAPRIAGVLARLDAEHALVFHGSDGLDELTSTGPSTVWEVRGGEVAQWTFDPAEHGVATATVDDLRGGDVQANRRIAESVLAGDQGAPRDIVLLGAAAALVAADRVDGWAAGLEAAAGAIDSGAAARVLDDWVRISQEQATGS